jgi:hypothetical protein
MRSGFAPSFAAEFPNDNPALHLGVSWVCLQVVGPPRPVARPRPSAVAPSVPVRAAQEEAAPTIEVAAPEPLPAAPASVSSPIAELSASDVVSTERPHEQALLTEPAPPVSDELKMESPAIIDERAPSVEPVAFEVAIDEDVTAMGDADAAPQSDVVAPEPMEMGEGAFAIDVPPTPEPLQAEAEPVPAEPDAYTAYVDALVSVALAAGATRAAATLPALLGSGALDVTAFSDDVQKALIGAGVVERSGDGLALRAAFASTASAWRNVLRGETNDLSACGTTTLDSWSADLLRAFGVGGSKDVRRELRGRGVAAFGMLVAA